jgi:tripartite-type tricarboxylate transporter receptor subunit TctC
MGHGRAVAIISVLACLVAGSTVARAAGDAVSFKGKSVRLLIGYQVGGGTDLVGRLVGRFLTRYLPDQPALVPQNMPGADGLVAMNYTAQQVAADGLTLFVASASPVMPEIMHGAGVLYDPATFLYIGGVANTGTVMVGSRTAQARLAMPGAEPVALAQVGGVRTGAQMVVWAVAYLGWNVKWVSGYPGTPELALALNKGEVDMTDTADARSLRTILADPRFVGVVQTGIFANGKLARRAGFPDIPILSELLEGKLPKEAESAYRSWLETTQIGKFFALPPGTPDAVVAAYRTAFRKMEGDPEFKALAAAQLDSDYVMQTPEDVRDVITAVVATPEADLAFINQLRAKVGVPGAK